MSTRDVFSEVKQCFEAGDLLAGLRCLNSHTPHRFTAMYLVSDEFCRNMFGIDKMDPSVTALPDVPGTASYCAFTRRRGKTLAFADAMEVPEFNNHPARAEVRSYCAVPLVDSEGNIFGTVCHFDYDVLPISDETVDLLERAAELLGYLPKSLYTDRANRTTILGDSLGFKSGMNSLN
jgi:GAF domain-containing protein